MGVTIHELRAVISGNLVGFSQMVDGAISKTQSLRKAWGDFAADASRAANRIVNTFGLIGGAVTGAAVKMGFGFNSIKEQSEIAFTTMLGDGKKAKAFIAELTEFAARTPFELPGLLDSTKKLMAFGFEAEKIIPMLTVVGDAASGLGNPAAMDFIIRALGQIQAKGKVAAQEMNQLAEQGIPAWQALADKIGVSIPEAMKLAEQGAISSAVAIPAILEGMDAKFRGLMEKQAGSMSGLLSTLMDRLRGWAGDAFLPIYDSIRNGMSKLLSGDSLGMIDGLSKSIQQSMKQVAFELDRLFNADPAAMFAAISEAGEKFVQVLVSLVKWVRETGPEFAAAGKYIWGFLEAILGYLTEHPRILAALIALKVTGMLGINSAVISLGQAMATTVYHLIAFIGRMLATTTATTANTAATIANTAAHTANAAAQNLSGGLGRKLPVGRAPIAPGNALGKTVASTGSIVAAEMAAGQVASGGFMATLGKIGAWFAGLPAMIGSAFASVGAWFAKLGALTTGITAAGTATVAAWAAIAVGVGVVIYKTGELIGAMLKYHAAVKEGRKLNDELLASKERVKDKEMEKLDSLPAVEREQAAEEQINKLREENARKQARKDQLDAEAKKRRSEDWGSSMFGNFAAREAEEESKRLQAEIAANDNRMNALREKQNAARSEPAGSPASPGGGGIFDIPQDQLDSIHGAGEQKAEGKRATKAQQELEKFTVALDEAFGELPEEQIEQMRQQFDQISQEFVAGDITAAQFKADIKVMSDEIDEATKVMERAEAAQDQFNASLDQFVGQVPDDELDAWHTAFGELRTAFEEGEINSAQFKRGIDVMNTAINDSAQMQDRFASMRETFGDQSVDGWVATFEGLQDELRSGEITAQVYKSEMAALNQEIQRSTQAEGERTQFLNQMGGLQQELAAKKIMMPDSFWTSFNDKFSALTQKFTTGAISANRFAQATDVLQREMDAAGQAAIKEMQLKERQRLLSGNFTQEEFQKAAEDRIIQMRMQQFDQYVDQAVNSMMGFNNGLQQMGGSLNQFGNNLQQFGNGFGGMRQQFDPEQLRAAQATYNAFARSVQGQMAGIINEIALAQQRLSLTSIITGDAIKGQERWSTITWIEELTRQLERLQNSPPPQFVAGLGDFRFNDPGLQTGQGAAGGSPIAINVNFPNVDAVSSRTASQLADAVRNELLRRGRPLFG